MRRSSWRPCASRNAMRPTEAAKKDPELTFVTNQLVVVYTKAGQHGKAATILVELWNHKKATLGPEDQGTLETMNHLGVVYWEMRRFDKSIPLFRELLKIRAKKLGADHAKTIHDGVNLAANLQDAGQLEEAIPLLQKAHEAASFIKRWTRRTKWRSGGRNWRRFGSRRGAVVAAIAAEPRAFYPLGRAPGKDGRRPDRLRRCSAQRIKRVELNRGRGAMGIALVVACDGRDQAGLAGTAKPVVTAVGWRVGLAQAPLFVP